MNGGKNSKTKLEQSNNFFNYIASFFHYINYHIVSLNSSKFFAGIIIILINIGSKFITIQFSKSTEEYLKYTISKQILIFCMAWMGTRDIYIAFAMTAILTILSDYLFNEESNLCIIPYKYRVLDKLIDINNDGHISETEINSAIAVLEKAKREKMRKEHKEIYSKNFVI